MAIFRLSAVSFLAAILIAGSAAAQSLQLQNPADVRPFEFDVLSFSGENHASLNLESPVQVRTPTGDDQLQRSQFSVPRHWQRPDRNSEPQADSLCYTMRSFKVARDAPHSDATHAAGYSTCQPAARFHMRTIDAVILVSAP